MKAGEKHTKPFGRVKPSRRDSGSPQSFRTGLVLLKTEGGETGASYFIGTTRCLPSNAESASFLDFVAAVDVTGRRRTVLMRSSHSSFPLVQLENPLPCAVKGIEGLSQQAMVLMESMSKGMVFVSVCRRQS